MRFFCQIAIVYELKLVLTADLFWHRSLCMKVILTRKSLLLHRYSLAQSNKIITIRNKIVIKWKYWPSGKEELKILRKQQWENKVFN